MLKRFTAEVLKYSDKFSLQKYNIIGPSSVIYRLGIIIL
jgi:hypothetical protein